MYIFIYDMVASFNIYIKYAYSYIVLFIDMLAANLNVINY